MFLAEDDVPRAKLKFTDVKDNNVAILKWWLACRNLKISGRKDELINRFSSCFGRRSQYPPSFYSRAQSAYDTPVNSGLLISPVSNSPIGSEFARSMVPSPPQMYEQRPLIQKTECTCSRAPIREVCRDGPCQPTIKNTSTSSSEECKCNEEEEESSENDQNTCYPFLTNPFNPFCCPCLQDVCCSCAQGLQLQQQLLQCCCAKQPKVKKKKNKSCKCTCSQTRKDSKDKAVCTNMVQVSDASVSCKPKSKVIKCKKHKKPQKVCCICKKSITCPAVRCCPCLLSPMCCPCNMIKQDTNKRDDDDENSDDESQVSKDKKEKRKNKKKAYNATEDSNDMKIYNAHVDNFASFRKAQFQPSMNILADLLSKSSISQSYNSNKLFSNDKFFSPLSRTSYNLNLMKIQEPNLKKYESFKPMNVNDSVKELMDSVNQIQGHSEHRALLTSACEAILSNRNRRNTVEGGESLFLDEYTYSPINDAVPSKKTYNETIRQKMFVNNFSNFTQTDQIINFSRPSAKTNTNAQTHTRNSVINAHSITDPINAYFNEKTQTEIDELFEDYMKKIRYNKLFSNPKDKNCQAMNETKEDGTETFHMTNELRVLKDALIQYENTLCSPEEIENHQGLLKNQEMNNNFMRNEPENIVNLPGNCPKINKDGNKLDTKNEVAKKCDTTISKSKSNKPSTSFNTMSVKEKQHNRERKYYSEHHCLSDDNDVTKLSLHSPRNIKPSSPQDDVHVAKTLLTNTISKKQLKRPSGSDDTNSKKRKLFPTTSLIDSNENNKCDLNNSQSKTKFKSKIPVIKKKSVTQNMCSHSNVTSNPNCLLNESPPETISNPEDTSGISSGLGSSKVDGTYEISEINENSENHKTEYKKDSFTTDLYFDRYINNNNSFPNSVDFLKNIESEMNSVSNTEVIISNIKYDSEDNMLNANKVYVDTFEPDTYSLSSDNQKSTLSIIKEENESDFTMNKNVFDIERYLDTCTSPFDFEDVCHSYIDSCNSPFEIKKRKERRMPLGLLCFTSNDKDNDPYRATDSSSSSEGKKSKSKERRRWPF